MTNITLRRTPWRSPISSLFDRDVFGRDMTRVFDVMPRLAFGTESVGLMPAMEISETDTEFTCVTELPGMAEKDVQVSFEDGELVIKGEKRDERESKKDGKRYHVVERSYGAFERSFSFPTHLDASKVTAEFHNGILTVHLPKTSNGQAKSRAIPIVTK